MDLVMVSDMEVAMVQAMVAMVAMVAMAQDMVLVVTELVHMEQAMVTSDMVAIMVVTANHMVQSVNHTLALITPVQLQQLQWLEVDSDMLVMEDTDMDLDTDPDLDTDLELTAQDIQLVMDSEDTAVDFMVAAMEDMDSDHTMVVAFMALHMDLALAMVAMVATQAITRNK